MTTKMFSHEGKKLTAEIYLVDIHKEEMYEVTLDEFRKEILIPELVEKYAHHKTLKDLLEELIEKGTKVYEVAEITAAKGTTMPCTSFYMVSTYHQTFFIRKRDGVIKDYKIVFKDSETHKELFTITDCESCGWF